MITEVDMVPLLVALGVIVLMAFVGGFVVGFSGSRSEAVKQGEIWFYGERYAVEPYQKCKKMEYEFGKVLIIDGKRYFLTSEEECDLEKKRCSGKESAKP